MDEGTVTALLKQLSAGRTHAADELLPLVYGELKRIARRYARAEPGGRRTLDTTALVHEAYLRLGLDRIAWNDRVHFFAVAARAMRRVLIDAAEARRAQKRGGGVQLLTLDDAVAAPEQRIEDLIALDRALDRLESIDPRQVRIVECHVLAGLTLDETAAALRISPATVCREWAMARAWLNQGLTTGADGSGKRR